MGKTKKPKLRHNSKTNPLGMLDISNMDTFGDELNESNDDGPIEAVRSQLQNANLEEKINGLQQLAVLSASKDKMVAVCRTDIIRIAAPLLCESDLAVRNAAAGALRNFSTSGPDLCDFLVEQDVMTPLLVLLNEYIVDTDWRPSFDTSMADQLDLRSDVFLQAINFLWNLCESSSIALETFNQTQLLAGLIRCLDYKVFGLDIAISVAQCLLVVSENNPKSWNILGPNVPSLELLLRVQGGNGHTYLRTLTAGILANVPAIAAAYSTAILGALAETLREDQSAALAILLTAASQEPVQQNGHQNELESSMDIVDEESDHKAAIRRRMQELPTEADIAVRDVGYLLDAQRVAAELITNICTANEEEWEDVEDGQNVSENGSVNDYDDEEEQQRGSCTNLTNNDRLPVEVVEVIKSTALAEHLWQKAQPTMPITAHRLREINISLLTKLKNLRISSLLCLQNLCNILNADDLGGPRALYSVWVELCQLVFKEAQDASILEPLTSLMRAALERLKSNRDLFQQMTKQDLELIINGIKNSGVTTVAEMRANWLRMLGTLGCLLNEELVKIIITYIIWSCENEEDVWTISEALDALMDIFGDNDWPELVVELNLTHIVKVLQKIFKAKLRQQRKELKDRYPAVRTVQDNLPRFVKHLEKSSTQTT